MDHTVRNASELEKALHTLTIGEQYNQVSDNQQPTPTDKHDSTHHKPVSSSKHRTNTGQYGSNQLLYNISGLQTATNGKLDALIDAMMRTQQIMQSVYTEQVRQTELLASIARNTAVNSSSRSDSVRQPTGKQRKEDSITNYGFPNIQTLVAELIVKLLKQVEVQVNSRGYGYRSTRIMDLSTVKRAVKIACSSEFKDSSSIQMPTNKSEAAIKLAEKIGAIDDLIPVLDANAFRELFRSTELRPIMSIIHSIIQRICVIRIVMPFYEADMINSISYPYFDMDGLVMCDWSKLSRRNETAEEAAVMNASVTNREKIGTLIAKGITVKSAIRAVLK